MDTVQQKLDLFKSLFKGRDDVFATYWEKDGKKGYAPANQKSDQVNFATSGGKMFESGNSVAINNASAEPFNRCGGPR